MIPTLAQALADQGYSELTPVQQAVTDPALENRDLLVSAQTGSGKTVGFGLAIGPSILDDAGMFDAAAAPLALIIAPTRELAMQVRRELQWLYRPAGAQLASCVGGMDFRDERRALERGTHIVVATPGRLRDHIMRGTIDLSQIKAVVLDEADEMLDLGFREDLEFILDSAPETRRTLMFSATVPPMIAKLAQSYQKDAERVITTSREAQHSDITYQAMRVLDHEADAAIINLLRYHAAPNAIVFANTRASVTRLTTRLSNRGFATVALSGELTQSERTHALQAMRDGRANVCVATDVAARGIDLPNLDLVIHAELPTNPETLLHRSGRTGRAGRKGLSVMIATGKMRRRAENLLKWGKLTAEWVAPPSADEITARDEQRLLDDPVWKDEFSEAEQAFAQKLLAQSSPEVIAAAYARLAAGQTAAPEEVSDVPDNFDRGPREDKPKRERAPFGPSRWFRIDLGREAKAEARWLLPMLCKAGEITKKEIGAIRIQSNETFVEIAEPAVAGFLRAIGPEMSLENQAKLSELDGAPNLGERGPRMTKRDYQDKPERNEGRPAKARGKDERPAPSAPSREAFTKPDTSRQGDRDTWTKPEAKDRKPRARDDDRKPARGFDKPYGDKPRGPRRDDRASEASDRKPYTKRDDRAGGTNDRKPYGKRDAGPSDKPRGKPAGKRDGKPFEGKGAPKSFDKPKGKPQREGNGNTFDKPRGKPARDGATKSFRSDAKPAAKPKSEARDTSKRFVPPGGKGKPSSGPRKGGNVTPRRRD